MGRSRISFPWYPQDWWNSDSHFELGSAEECWIYLECLFLMYNQEGFISSSREAFERRRSRQVSEQAWINVTNRFLHSPDGSKMISKTVFDRLEGLIQQTFTGSLSGKTESQKKALRIEYEKGVKERLEAYLKANPRRVPSDGTLKANPESQYKVIEYNSNTKGLSKPVGMVKGADSKPPDASPSPLWAVGTPSGSDITAAWKKYGDHLETILEKLDRPRMIKAWRNYWPYELKPEEWEKIDKFLAEAPEQYIRFGLDAIGESLRTADVKDFSEPVEFAECYLTEKTS
jgi:hypothetical protein